MSLIRNTEFSFILLVQSCCVAASLIHIRTQCGGSGMFIPDPGSWFLPIPDPGSRIPDPGSRIPDPKTVTKERGEKKFVIILFFVVTNFTKLNIMLFLKLLKFLPKKFSICSQIYGFGIPDPGVKKALDPGSRIRIRNTVRTRGSGSRFRTRIRI